MQAPAQDNYLVNDVMTASPAKLHLMAVEVALRASQRVKILWDAKQEEAALAANLHGQKAMSTLLAGLNYETRSPLIREIAGNYLFVYRSMINAQLRRDPAHIDDAIRVLEIERETWRQACLQNPDKQPSSQQERPSHEAIPAPLSGRFTAMTNDIASESGFSCEA